MSNITLYIAEKPSMARDLAFALGAKKKEGIKYVGTGVWVSWCIGHLVEIANPDQHDPRWKSWRLSELPILPQKLKWLPKAKTKSHFNQLTKLIKSRQVAEVVNACDAGREGELIFRAVYQVAGGHKPVKRFWVSSLTNEAIRKGLQQLRPSQDFDPLAAAAYCRAEADWLVGMNATRALTARASDLLSLGRVQTPTLNMIVKRQEAIDHFQAETYWVLDIIVLSKTGAQWTARWHKKHAKSQLENLDDHLSVKNQTQEKTKRSSWLKSPQDAQKIIEKIKPAIGEVVKAEGKNKQIPPPLLYHLTALQQECNRRFSFTADQTLKIAQSLYETHKLISYPRTDSRYLTPDVARTIPQILNQLPSKYQNLLSQCTVSPQKLGKRYINAQKVSDHHAIIPTNRQYDLNKLKTDEAKVYDLIVRSLLCALCPPALDQQAVLVVDIAQELFIAKGTVELKAGWRALAPHQHSKVGKGKANTQLPFVPIHTPVRAIDAQVLEKQTQAPKAYNDASLLGAMEHAGKQIEDAELRAVMRAGGLGTPATRANIIATLIRRGYISRAQKTLIPTLAGQTLVASVNDPALLEPQLTAEWEQRLQDIAEGKAPAHTFIQQIHAWVNQLVCALPQGPKIQVPKPEKKHGKKQSKYTSRGKSEQNNTHRSAGESSWRSQTQKAKQNTQNQKRPRASELNEVVGQTCPICKKGNMIQGQSAWGCERWKAGCKFIIPFAMNGVLIPKEEAARICARRQSRLFHENDGQKYRIELQAKGKLAWAESKSKNVGNSKVKSSKRSAKTSSQNSKKDSWRSKAVSTTPHSSKQNKWATHRGEKP